MSPTKGSWPNEESICQWSQVESYQRLKKWYLMPPCLTLSIIRYGSRVKWSSTGKGVTPSPTHRYRSYWKGSLRVILDCGVANFTFTYCLQYYLFECVQIPEESHRIRWPKQLHIRSALNVMVIFIGKVIGDLSWNLRRGWVPMT